MFEREILNLLRVNLNLKEEERILIFTDTEKNYLKELLPSFREVALRITPHVKVGIYDSLKVHGTEPPKELWSLTFGQEAVQRLEDKGFLSPILTKGSFPEEEVIDILKELAIDVPQVVVAFPYFSTTHTFYRKLLTDVFGARYASMPLFDPEMFKGPMDVEWDYVAKLSGDIAELLTEGEWVHVVSPSGTDIEFSIRGRKAIGDTGLFHEPGEFGNLPAGEAFIAPEEKEAYGRLVIEYAPDRKLERPITFRFREGAVELIEGFEDYRYDIEDIFKRMPEARYIAEFGVGTNPKAKRADNILEAEKILGTIHIAIGDNHTFGGTNRVSFHTDYVVFQPTVVIGGKGWEKKLLERGKLHRI
jgi:leucyl aminopeptidase (aminopeptidase T)